MKQSEARVLIKTIEIMAQKARSTLIEGLCGYDDPNQAEQNILGMLNPYLFPEYSGKKIGILDAAIITGKAESIAPSNLCNLLWLVSRENTMMVMSAVYRVNIPRFDDPSLLTVEWTPEDQ